MLSLIHSPAAGQHIVIGLLKNEEPHGIVDAWVRVSLHKMDGELIAEQLVPLLVKHVSAGAVVPFRAVFADVERANKAEARIASFPPGAFEPGMLAISFAGGSFTAEGRYALLGWISNQGNSAAEIHQLILMALNEENAPQEIVIVRDRLSSIFPAQAIPFLAIFEQIPEPTRLLSFIDTIANSGIDPAPLSLVQPVGVTFDPQGNILVTGTIKNESSHSHWVYGLVVLTLQDEILSVAELHPPSPFGPGETRAFGGMDFPEWASRLAAANGHREDISAEFLFDPLASAPTNIQTRPLDFEITGLETTGSMLFLRGTIYNNAQFPISQPSIHAELRSVDNIAHSANWHVLPQRLEPRQSASFLLPLRIPEGINLAMMEVDIRAMGLLDESSFPGFFEP